ncbi:hypothetical protein P280DRAFT_517051 [Massarina eburnea CBS 473.64]|uniref:Uncharacterized protein n=1 Tax=Massarina eburnea CBS 473.64 TaxID=1395130 RepID=A0A6A6S4H9_9PLEO|nr:hypothetical protein P280DRAFT_517051 [Massarina eburnea CBS 473.64]
MHGVVLKVLVRISIILEFRKPDQLKAQAAGLGLGPEAQELLKMYTPPGNAHVIDTPASQFLNVEGAVINEIPQVISVITSSWTLVFEKLKTKFEDVIGVQG